MGRKRSNKKKKGGGGSSNGSNADTPNRKKQRPQGGSQTGTAAARSDAADAAADDAGKCSDDVLPMLVDEDHLKRATPRGSKDKPSRPPPPPPAIPPPPPAAPPSSSSSSSTNARPAKAKPTSAVMDSSSITLGLIGSPSAIQSRARPLGMIDESSRSAPDKLSKIDISGALRRREIQGWMDSPGRGRARKVYEEENDGYGEQLRVATSEHVHVQIALGLPRDEMAHDATCSTGAVVAGDDGANQQPAAASTSYTSTSTSNSTSNSNSGAVGGASGSGSGSGSGNSSSQRAQAAARLQALRTGVGGTCISKATSKSASKSASKPAPPSSVTPSPPSSPPVPPPPGSGATSRRATDTRPRSMAAKIQRLNDDNRENKGKTTTAAQQRAAELGEFCNMHIYIYIYTHTCRVIYSEWHTTSIPFDACILAGYRHCHCNLFISHSPPIYFPLLLLNNVPIDSLFISTLRPFLY